MSLLGSLVGGFLGAKSDAKANKRAKEELKVQQKLADQQIDIAKYIKELGQQVVALNGQNTDYYGTSVYRDPVTGEYKFKLGNVPANIQGMSDDEEAARYGGDQAIRRSGLRDFESMRGQSVQDALADRDRLQAFRRGAGAIDPEQLGSQLRLDRTRAVNAGFDDAERAAGTLQLRTGSSAVGDALSDLARSRVRAQAEIGSPEVEALQMAEGINRGRERAILDSFNNNRGVGMNFYDAAFNPSNRAGDAYDRLADLMKFDLSKYDLAMGGEGTAAQTIGNAARERNAAYKTTEANRVRSPWGNFIASADRNIESAIMKALSGGMGGPPGGMSGGMG